MKHNEFIKSSKVMMDQGLQATEATLELLVHSQQHGAEKIHEAIETSMTRTREACLSGLDMWKEGVTTTVGLAQDLTKKFRAGLAAPAPKAPKA